MIPLFKVGMSKHAGAKVAEVLNSGYIGQGEKVKEFEGVLSDYLGHPDPVTTNSGTSALSLALRLITDDIKGSGRDEVLAAPITCTATNWPILAAGLKIRWVDTNPADGNMDIEDLNSKLSPRTAAIMLIHWGGYPNDLAAVRAAQRYCTERFGFRPAVIEDAAHAFGSTYGGNRLGNYGNYCMYSFQAIKHLTAVDGGVLLCPDERLTKKARLLRWYGIDRESSENFRCEGDIAEWGYKYHMNDVCATIGMANMSLLDGAIHSHRNNAACYRSDLTDVPGITLLEEKANRSSSYWLFTIRAKNRDGLSAKLKERGIASGRVHERNDRYSCTQEFRDNSLFGTDVMHTEMLCIPVGWWVTREDRERIVSVIKEGW